MSKQNNRINSEGHLKSKGSHMLTLQPLKLTEGLLVVGGIRPNLIKLQAYMPEIKQTHPTTLERKTKLVNTLQKVNQRTNFKIKQTMKSTTTEEIQQKKQTAKPTKNINMTLQSPRQHYKIQSKIKQIEEQNNVFVEKKMKLGKINKTNAMKQFIIDMLSKGKAQGTCLTIHKGTSQCTNPLNREFNVSQISQTHRQNKSKDHSQDSRAQPIIKKRSFLRIPTQKPKIPKGTSTKNSVNLPNITKNKKYVVMMKKMQKNRQKKDQIAQQIQQTQEIQRSQQQNNLQAQITQEIQQEITQ